MPCDSPKERLEHVMYPKCICFSFLENQLTRKHWTQILVSDNETHCALQEHGAATPFMTWLWNRKIQDRSINYHTNLASLIPGAADRDQTSMAFNDLNK